MDLISEIRFDFEAYRRDQIKSDLPEGLYPPIEYIMQMGGKRIRPILLILAYRLFDDNWKQALPAAYAIELFHNFSLVHDDIMDEAPLRRGLATVHVKYGRNTGILSGDVMMIQVMEYLLAYPTELAHRICSLFTQTAIGVCEGQQLDMNFETTWKLKEDDYLEMIEKKTAILLAEALRLGAILAGADKTDVHHLYRFGLDMGIAFQIQDDYLDTYGDPEHFGKQVGGDIINNKKTILVLRCLQLCNEEDAHKLKLLLSGTFAGSDPEKIELVKQLLDKYNIGEQISNIQLEHQDRAFKQLSELSIEEGKLAGLIELTKSLIHRQR